MLGNGGPDLCFNTFHSVISIDLSNNTALCSNISTLLKAKQFTPWINERLLLRIERIHILYNKCKRRITTPFLGTISLILKIS